MNFLGLLFQIFLFILCKLNLTQAKGGKFIKIPFYKKSSPDPSSGHFKIFGAIEKNTLVADIKLGTPSQNLKLDIQQDCPFFYIYSDNVIMDPPISSDIIKFISSESQTYNNEKKIDLKYEYFSQLYLSKDKLIINDYLISNEFHFSEPYTLSTASKKVTESGCLGIGNRVFGDEDEAYSNFILNLKRDDIIDNYDYFFEFFNETHGQLIIGGEPNDYNPKAYKNRINSYARNPSDGKYVTLGFKVDSMYYEDIKINISTKFNAEIKADVGLMEMPRSLENFLVDEVFHQFINESICEVFNYWTHDTIICKKNLLDKTKLGVLNIYNLELKDNFKIDLKNVWKDVGDTSYLLMEFKRDDNFGIVLGEPFLRENLITFNQDKKVLGIYIPNDSDSNNTNKKNKKVFVVLLVIGIIIEIMILAAVFYFVYKKRFLSVKKRAIELTEDDGYIKFN